ncbi:DoxX family protein [Mucilaginibacter agri]|nr:DoxX family protein [Mucilaginibacter agri]
MTTLAMEQHTVQGTKTTKVVYWVFTTIFFLLDSVMPAFTFNTPLAKQGISHLGYPDYFRIELTVGKIIGGLLLILPMVPPRYKEWAYVGFGISIISAFVGHLAVDGMDAQTFIPVVGFAILLISYVCYHKLYAPFKSN